MTSLADPIEEARRIIGAAAEVGLAMRAVGGVAVALVAPTVQLVEPRRTYHDIDLVARTGAPAITRVLTSLGYGPALPFNTLNGSERLLFHDVTGRRVDIFVGTIRMCHELRLDDRVPVAGWPLTLAPVDLLLSKLQIVELTDRDAQDALALLADHALTEIEWEGLELERVRDVCGRDWGWWRTVDDNLARLIARWTDSADPLRAVPDAARFTAIDRAAALRTVLATCPRSLAWRLRAAVGPRVRWYEIPEEVR